MKEICLLYDDVVVKVNVSHSKIIQPKANYGIEFYENSYIPINHNVQECYIDFHLPLKVLIHKYYPNLIVKYITKSEVSVGTKFIYTISFTYFYDYLKSNSVEDIFHALDSQLQKSIRNGDGILFLNDSHEYSTYLNILGAINSIDKSLAKQIVIASSNLDNQKYLGTNLKLSEKVKNTIIKGYIRLRKPSIPIFGYRFFEEVVSMQMASFYADYTFERKLKALKNSHFKTFICLNNIVKPHRVAISFLLHKNKLDKNYISQKVVDDEYYQALKVAGWGSLILENEFNKFKTHLPLKADEISSKDQNNPWSLIPFKLVDNSFVWLVTETIYEGTGLSRCFFTEKTYKPISLFMPFILIAQPYALHNLKQDGYITFDRWWDESYDLEVNEIKRMEKILEVVKYVCSKSKEDLIQMYQEMKIVLEHNYNQLKNTEAAKPFVTHLIEQYNSKK